MEQPSRRLMIVSTVATGLLMLLGFTIAVYASEHSRSVDMGDALFGPLLIQFLTFLVMVYHCLVWERFVRSGIDRTAAYNAQHSLQVDLARGLRLVCYGMIGMDAFIFLIVVYHSIQLLNA